MKQALQKITIGVFITCSSMMIQAKKKDFQELPKTQKEAVTQEWTQAIKKGDVDALNKLLKNYNNLINVDVTKQGFTALHLAAKLGKEDVIKLLVKKGADISLKDERNRTPLFLAAENNNTNSITPLISKGAKVNIQDKQHKTALHYAVIEKAKNAVEALLQKEADPNLKDKDGKTPLHYAAQNGHREITTALVNNHAQRNIQDKEGKTPLHYAVKNKQKDAIYALLRKDANPYIQDKSGKTPLHIALDIKAKDMFLTALKDTNQAKSLTQNARNQFFDAIQEKNYQKVMHFTGTYPGIVKITNDKGITALHLAAKQASPTIARTLLTYGADVNATDKQGNKPIHLAARAGASEVIDVLIKQKAKVNVTNENEETPLYLALISKNKESAQTLFKHTSEYKLQLALSRGKGKEYFTILQTILPKKDITQDVRTTWFQAARNDNDAAIYKALNTYPHIRDITDNEGNTALHIAAKNANHNIVDILLKCGAKINAQNTQGNTASHLAMQHAIETGETQTIKLLIKQNARLDIKNNDDLSPYGVLYEAWKDADKDSNEHSAMEVVRNNFTTENISPELLEKWTVKIIGLRPLEQFIQQHPVVVHSSIKIDDDEQQHPFPWLIESARFDKNPETDVNKVRTLQKYGADINQKFNINILSKPAIKGATILHYAVILSCKAPSYANAVIKKLLDLGVDRNIRDSKGRTPLELSQQTFSYKYKYTKRSLPHIVEGTQTKYYTPSEQATKLLREYKPQQK